MSKTEVSGVLAFGPDGVPRSLLYGDVYFSRQDGLAESQAVFLQGCGLPEAWQGRQDFTVAELGFGAGRNILALLSLWRRTRPPAGRLHIFSIEAHPLSRGEAERALASWPSVREEADSLLAAWPSPTPGFHRLDFSAWSAVLDVAVMEVGEALAQWRGLADAWFLDGFSPALNPAMWRPEVLRLVGERSAPQARAASFTVAGAVRRGLAEAGLEVHKAPGFGHKRERLAAQRLGAGTRPPRPGSVAVLGAGIAGASLARALRAQGIQAGVWDAEGPGAGASGNPAALVAPRLDAGLGRAARLHAQAFERAACLYAQTPGVILGRGVAVLEAGERDASRFRKIADSRLFPAGEAHLADQAELAGRLAEPAGPGLVLDGALTVRPDAVLGSWLGDVRRRTVDRLERLAAGWRLIGAGDEILAEVDAVCLALGPATSRFAPGLPLQSVRGQANLAACAPPGLAVSYGGYAIAAPQGLLFGATFDRDDQDFTVRDRDSQANLRKLASRLPRLAKAAAAAPLGARASVRAATPDRLPLAGAIEPGLFVLAGLGSHGFTLAPLLAEAVAADIAASPSPLPRDLAALVSPARYSAP